MTREEIEGEGWCFLDYAAGGITCPDGSSRQLVRFWGYPAESSTLQEGKATAARGHP